MLLLYLRAEPAAAEIVPGICVGDCNGDGVVLVNELVVGVNITLETRPITDCPAFNVMEDLRVSISELVLGVRALLDGCEPPVPSATRTPSVTPTPSITASVYPGPSVTNTPRPTQPPSLIASVDGALVRLAWPTPDPGTGNVRSRLLRKLNSPPLGPDDPDATQLADFSTDLATDDVTDLLPDTSDRAGGTLRVYYYSVYPCGVTGNCDPAGMTTLLRLTLTDVLRAGGYTIYWRHAPADICQDCTALGPAATTTLPNWWKSCDSSCPADQNMCATAGMATARQLNPSGSQQAQAIGAAIRDRSIPFGRVVSSEFCRCVQTAQLMSLGPRIEPNQGITFLVYDEENRCTHAQGLLALPPTSGTNTGIVGHSGFVCPTLDQLAMGESAIFKHDGNGSAEYIARLAPSDWVVLGTPTPSPSATPTLHPSITPTPTATAIAITAHITGDDVQLMWPTPNPSTGYTHSRVLRRLNVAPEWPHDPQAIQLYNGTQGSTADEVTELLPDAAGVGGEARTYYYRVYACREDGSCDFTGGTTTFALSLAAALRAGGYTIYWRHAEANVCTDCSTLGTASTTSVPDWWKSCNAMCPVGDCTTAGMATARQISSNGVQQAQMIGQAIRDRDIPFDRVLSSEYCRCIQTAEQMNLGPEIEPDPGLTYFVYDEANRCTHAYERIVTPPADATNTAIIGHGGFVPDCTALSNLQMGDAAIFKPDGNGDAAFVAQLIPSAWADLPD